MRRGNLFLGSLLAAGVAFYGCGSASNPRGDVGGDGDEDTSGRVQGVQQEQPRASTYGGGNNGGGHNGGCNGGCDHEPPPSCNGHDGCEPVDPCVKYSGRATVVSGSVGNVLGGLTETVDGAVSDLLGGVLEDTLGGVIGNITGNDGLLGNILGILDLGQGDDEEQILLDLNLADTGELPEHGGELSDDGTAIVIPGIANLTLLEAFTKGEDGKVFSQAKLATAFVGGDNDSDEQILGDLLGDLLGDVLELPQVFAGAVTVKAKAECKNGRPDLSGHSEFVNVRILGETIEPIDGETEVVDLDLPLLDDALLRITFNEVTKTRNNVYGKVEVKGVHIELPILDTDVVLGYAEADITCSCDEVDPCYEETEY